MLLIERLGSNECFVCMAACSTEAGTGIFRRARTTKCGWLIYAQCSRLLSADGKQRLRELQRRELQVIQDGSRDTRKEVASLLRDVHIRLRSERVNENIGDY